MNRDKRETLWLLAVMFGTPVAVGGGLWLASIGAQWAGVPLVLAALLVWCWVAAQ